MAVAQVGHFSLKQEIAATAERRLDAVFNAFPVGGEGCSHNPTIVERPGWGKEG
jgi:hypothetical protein